MCVFHLAPDSNGAAAFCTPGVWVEIPLEAWQGLMASGAVRGFEMQDLILLCIPQLSTPPFKGGGLCQACEQMHWTLDTKPSPHGANLPCHFAVLTADCESDGYSDINLTMFSGA